MRAKFIGGLFLVALTYRDRVSVKSAASPMTTATRADSRVTINHPNAEAWARQMTIVTAPPLPMQSRGRQASPDASSHAISRRRSTSQSLIKVTLGCDDSLDHEDLSEKRLIRRRRQRSRLDTLRRLALDCLPAKIFAKVTSCEKLWSCSYRKMTLMRRPPVLCWRERL